MKKYLLRLIAIVSLLAIWSFIIHSTEASSAEPLRMNQIQVIGSHNSYKQAIEDDLMKMMLVTYPAAKELDYYHLPIAEQLNLGLRSLELDVLYDPEGGRYTQPVGFKLMGENGLEAKPYDTTELSKPGFKTFHVPDIDFRSTCLTFKACLNEIRNWSQSESSQGHLPIIITINPKNSGVSLPGFTEVLKFDEAVWEEFDQEILEIFSAEELITPALVKGSSASLKEAVRKEGWPAIDDVRGKIMFVLDAPENNTLQYLASNNYDRPMFVNVPSDHDHSAFLIKNDPKKQEEEIKELVLQGYMVRTRADANTSEARLGDLSRFEAAQRSGAQVISTDYYLKEQSPNKDFEIVFEDSKYVRCSPILNCESVDFE